MDFVFCYIMTFLASIVLVVMRQWNYLICMVCISALSVHALYLADVAVLMVRISVHVSLTMQFYLVVMSARKDLCFMKVNVESKLQIINVFSLVKLFFVFHVKKDRFFIKICAIIHAFRIFVGVDIV